MFLTICGNVDNNEIVNVVDDFMLSQEFNDYSNPIWLKEDEPFKVKKEKDQITVNVGMAKLMISIKLNNELFKDMEKVKVITLLNLLLDINFGPTSSFNEYLLDNDLKDELFFYVSYEEDNIIINFEISTNKTKIKKSY